MISDSGWQKIINDYGIDVAFQVLLNEFKKHESLKQPSPNLDIPTVTTDNSGGNEVESDIEL